MDVTGHVREMPGEPKNSRMCGRVHSKSYACTEAGGLLWIYMGAGDPPPLPRFAWMDLPAGHFAVRKAVYNVNFLQSLEVRSIRPTVIFFTARKRAHPETTTRIRFMPMAGGPGLPPTPRQTSMSGHRVWIRVWRDTQGHGGSGET